MSNEEPLRSERRIAPDGAATSSAGGNTDDLDSVTSAKAFLFAYEVTRLRRNVRTLWRTGDKRDQLPKWIRSAPEILGDGLAKQLAKAAELRERPRATMDARTFTKALTRIIRDVTRVWRARSRRRYVLLRTQIANATYGDEDWVLHDLDERLEAVKPLGEAAWEKVGKLAHKLWYRLPIHFARWAEL